MEELNLRSATRRDRCTAFSAVTGGDGCHWSRLPLIEILLGFGKLLDIVRGVLESDELATIAGRGIESSKWRDQSAM
jgi:hypothetical protein